MCSLLRSWGKSFWFFSSSVFPFLSKPPCKLILSFPLIFIPPVSRQISTSPITFRTQRRQEAMRLDKYGGHFLVLSDQRFFLLLLGTTPPLSWERSHLPPALRPHHSGDGDFILDSNQKYVTQAGQSEPTTSSILGDWFIGSRWPSKQALQAFSELGEAKVFLLSLSCETASLIVSRAWYRGTIGLRPAHLLGLHMHLIPQVRGSWKGPGDQSVQVSSTSFTRVPLAQDLCAHP